MYFLDSFFFHVFKLWSALNSLTYVWCGSWIDRVFLFIFFCFLFSLSRITEDSTGTTLEALKARIRELEKQILRGDRYKCLICMV